MQLSTQRCTPRTGTIHLGIYPPKEKKKALEMFPSFFPISNYLSGHQDSGAGRYSFSITSVLELSAASTSTHLMQPHQLSRYGRDEMQEPRLCSPSSSRSCEAAAALIRSSQGNGAVSWHHPIDHHGLSSRARRWTGRPTDRQRALGFRRAADDATDRCPRYSMPDRVSQLSILFSGSGRRPESRGRFLRRCDAYARLSQ